LDPGEGFSIKQKDKKSGGPLKKGSYYEGYKFEEIAVIEEAIIDFLDIIQSSILFCV
jgi:hypothetical protein